MADPTWDNTVAAAGRNPADNTDNPPPGAAPKWEETNDPSKYETLPQEALTALEGAGEGFVGPVATGTERLLSAAGVPGISPAEQAARATVNPGIHGVSEVGGLAGGMLTGTGEARLLTAAGEGAAKLGAKAGLGKLGQGILSGAIGNALFQTGDEISKRINNPQLAASSAVANIGLSALIGGGAGAILSKISPLWRKANQESVEQGIQDFNNSMTDSVVDQEAQKPIKQIEESGLSKWLSRPKQNAAELADITQRNQWPMLPGMTSDAKLIQRGVDDLLNGPPTLSSIQFQKMYGEGFDKVSSAVDRASNAPAEAMSETEVGNALKQSMTQKLEAENAPIKRLYDALEEYQSQIPVADRTTGKLSKVIGQMIEDKGLVEGSERHNFVKTFADGIDQVDNLLKLKNFRTEVGRSSGPLTRDLAQSINEELNGVEEKAIEAFAENMPTPEAKQNILELLDEVKGAKKIYADFRGKLQTLGASLGKKRIAGPQDFLNFVDELNPQTLARRIFNGNNTEFANFFAEHFPEEMGTMRDYQRGMLRELAMKDGVFQPRAVIKKVLDPRTGMEPEMQKLLFSPQELQTLREAKTYLEAFPDSFNPSGTAHESAFRAFFEHPTGAAIANLRDFGIQAFISAFDRAAPGSASEAGKILPLLGNAVGGKEVNAGAFKHAVEFAVSTVKGENLMGRAAKSVFLSSIPVSATLIPDEEHLARLDKKVKDFKTNPDHYAQVGGEVGHYLPNHDIALKGLAAGAINYLNSIRPATTKSAPLDPEIEPSAAQKSEYNRALAIAERPLSVISLLKEGRITSQDVAHLKNLYPGLHQNLAQKLTEEMINHVSKEKPVPYATRAGLSLLLGQPLDSSLTPQSVQANQAAFGQANAQANQPGAGGSKRPAAGLKQLKMSSRLSLRPGSED